jgi:hypothetical protein
MKPLPTLIGPLQLDARLCRLMGWTEAEINEVTTHLHFIAQEHAELCAVRAPELWRRNPNGLIYVGELPADPRAGKRGPFHLPMDPYPDAVK